MQTATSTVECHQREQRSSKSKRYELAPLASFEDLEEFKPKSLNSKKNCLPAIEDADPRPGELNSSPQVNTLQSQKCPPKSTAQRPGTIRPMPVSVLDDTGSDNITPPTPRIDISCASSSSTISDELSASEKELRKYGLGLECKEDMDDLRSSTEEIAFEASSKPPEETLRPTRFTPENLRRASHPTNLFSRKASTATLGECFSRKPSVYSFHSATLSPRTGRHSSFGAASPRPKSCAPSPTPSSRSGRRSVSPHLFMYQTSFCGSRPALVDCEPEIYAPEVSTLTVEVHPSPCDNSSYTTKAQVEPLRSPSPERRPSTSKLVIKPPDGLWCEPFVIPNQPSVEEPDEEASSDKVRVESPHDQLLLNCTKDESTDFSDKDTKFENENISDEGEEETPEVVNKFVPPTDLSTPPESKGLFLDETLDDDSSLPYVPTTLPLEKSAAVPIVPIRERIGHFVPTTPIQRPRSTQPPNLTSIEDYITVNSQKSKIVTTEKMKISLPRDDSMGDEPRTPKKELPTTWTNFAEMGLRNPRNLRRELHEESK